jgi:hypothetical protein
MSSTELLGVYLTDHLAGSTAALDHVEKMSRGDDGSPLAVYLAELARDIRADREVLEDLIGRLGVDKSPMTQAKQAAASIAEKVGRLKFAEQVTRSADLSRLLELEALQLGIEGKHAMWRVLSRLAPSDPRLADLDYAELMDRARQQVDGVERYKLEAAARAFAA